MPTFGFLASQLVLQHDVISLHLPQLDAAGLALRGRLFKKPTVITYHCDLKMPLGILSWAASQGVHLMNHIAANFTHRIVAYTQDYAENSPYLNRYKNKLSIIPPPILLPQSDQYEVAEFNRVHNPDHQQPIIGFAARFASEKGVEVLLKALPIILQKHPKALVWFAGPYQNVLGEEKYYQRLRPTIESFIEQGHWKFLGILEPRQMSAFYPNLDLLVVSSLNSTESFGLVQIEAMMNNVPVVASNLPGVRQPIIQHGLGKVFPVGDADALAKSICEVIQKFNQKKPHALNLEIYAPDRVASEYENLFCDIQKKL